MSTISIQQLTFSYGGGGEPVFRDLSLQIDTSWHLGLIGRNGRGKTTLLKLLSGELEGGRALSVPLPCRRFPAPVPDPERRGGEVLSALCPQAQEWEQERELSLLGLDPEVLERPYSTLSGGEQTKLLLASLFLEETAFPLIDEPTNHLDRAGRKKVAAYLRRQRGFLLVSHDRAFLDGCTDHILALEPTGPRLQAGNWSTWQEEDRRRTLQEERRDGQLKKEISQLRQAARRAGEWSRQVEKTKTTGATVGGVKADKGHIGHMAAKMAKRSKSIEARRLSAAEEKEGLLRNREEAPDLKLSPLPFQGRYLARLREVAPVYGDRAVCLPQTFDLTPGDRVALTGPNGCGKTSLLRLLTGAEADHTGELLLSPQLVVSYVPQSIAGLRGSLEARLRDWEVDGVLCRSILRYLGLDRQQLERELSGWSAGQKKKLLLARSLCERAHLYLWDEPLNYLDIWSRQQLEDLVLNYRPTLLFIEHDRAFQERIQTREVKVKNEK